VNNDCSEKYTCSAPLSLVAISSFKPCSEDAVCSFVAGQNPVCRCILGFVGDGYNCTSDKKLTISILPPRIKKT